MPAKTTIARPSIHATRVAVLPGAANPRIDGDANIQSPRTPLTMSCHRFGAKAALVNDVSLLRNPINLDELNALIGEVLNRPRRSRLARLRTTGAKLGHDEPNPEARLLTDS